MKTTLKIARNELRTLFYSPVAWFLLITFFVMCAYFYTELLYPWAKPTYLMLKTRPDWVYRATGSVTGTILLHPQGGFFVNILPYIYLFVPLLTMGVISMEFNKGTSKLLYSSPVSLRQIVLGKYIALMIYNLLFVLILGVFILSAFFDIKSLDYWPVLSAVLGTYLLLCAFTAIGFFMSSLTIYPIVAAIASSTILFILMYVGQLWQDYDFVRDITWSLAINNRTEKMIAGLVTTRDVIYYLVIISMFVCFTILKLKDGREAKPWFIKIARYLIVMVCGLSVGYISARPGFIKYWDGTRLKTNTLHPRTQDIIKEFGDSALEVTLYTNLIDKNAPNGLPVYRNNYMEEMWEPYQRFKPDIKFKYEYYYDYDPASDDSELYKRFPGKTLRQIAGLLARIYKVDSSIFKSPEEMHAMIDLGPEDYRMIMQLKFKGRTTFLRTNFSGGLWGGTWPIEAIVNAAFKRLLGAKIPKIYFVSGELERSILKSGEREYKKHTILKVRGESLVNIGFDVDTINLKTQEIPIDATTIVLADPRMALVPTVENKLKNYIGNGGNMLILGEPGKQYVLNSVLKSIGVQLMNGQLVQVSDNETPDKVMYDMTPFGFDLAEEWWLMINKHLFRHNIYDTITKIWAVGATGISLTTDSGFSVKPLLTTAPGRTWLKAGWLVTDSVPPVFSALEGDLKENSVPIAIQLSRQKANKEQRIIVCGDADLLSNLRINDDYGRGVYSWLNYNEFPIYTPIPYSQDNLVVVSPWWAERQKLVYVWVLPGILLISAAILLIRRKRK